LFTFELLSQSSDLISEFKCLLQPASAADNSLGRISGVRLCVRVFVSVCPVRARILKAWS